MKKFKLMIFILILFMITAIPTVSAKDFNVLIDSISLEEKSDTASDLRKATFDNLDVNFKLKFFNVGDYAKYKIVLKNGDDKDYYINNFETEKDYLKYTYSFDNDSNKLEANSTKEIYVTVTYNKKVPDSMLDGGNYTNLDVVNILITDSDGNIINPDTGSLLSKILIGLLIVCGISCILLIKNKKSRLLVLFLLLMPVVVYAKDKISINMNVKTILAKNYVNNCVMSDEMVQGVEYKNGQYTYRYMQESTYSTNFQNIDQDGWGVVLTDLSSTDPVTTPLCTSINDKPIVSMSFMFAGSQASSIDMSSFDTSNVVNMRFMFAGVKTDLDLSSFNMEKVTNVSYMFHSVPDVSLKFDGMDSSKLSTMDHMFSSSKFDSLDLSDFDAGSVTSMNYAFESMSDLSSINFSNFDTGNAVSMIGMFMGCGDVNLDLDLSSFNTSNVLDMNSMFAASQASSIDFSSFNTSNVTNMYSMFFQSKVKSLDLSSFDTSNVTDMDQMFRSCDATEINLSSFNTSKLVDMRWMFADSKATVLDLSSFDTSNMTSMWATFQNSAATTINLSSFDTSNVTAMYSLFEGTNVKSLDLSGFDTSKVVRMEYMFKNSKIEVLDLSSFDISSIGAVGVFGMFENVPATVGYARTQDAALKFNNSNNKPDGLVFTVKNS